MELRSVENDSQWETLLEAQPNATLFHTTDWLRFQERATGRKLVRLVVRHKCDDVGVFPLFISRRGPLRVAASPRGIDYLILGPLAPPQLLGELLAAYENWAHANRISYTSIAFTDEIDASAATTAGYACEKHTNCVVSLDGGEDAVFARMASECRRRIRQAQAAGVEIIEGDLTPWLDRYVQLSAEIFAKSNLETQLNTTVLADMLRTLSRSDSLLTLRAEVNGQIAGMWIAGVFRQTLYGLDIVTDRAMRRCSASNMIDWYALQWACGRGLTALDLGGGRIASLAEFKKSLGAQLLPYSNITRAHGPAARTALACKRLIGRARAAVRRRL